MFFFAPFFFHFFAHFCTVLFSLFSQLLQISSLNGSGLSTFMSQALILGVPVYLLSSALPLMALVLLVLVVFATGGYG